MKTRRSSKFDKSTRTVILWHNLKALQKPLRNADNKKNNKNRTANLIFALSVFFPSVTFANSNWQTRRHASSLLRLRLVYNVCLFVSFFYIDCSEQLRSSIGGISNTWNVSHLPRRSSWFIFLHRHNHRSNADVFLMTLPLSVLPFVFFFLIIYTFYSCFI